MGRKMQQRFGRVQCNKQEVKIIAVSISFGKPLRSFASLRMTHKGRITKKVRKSKHSSAIMFLSRKMPPYLVILSEAKDLKGKHYVK